MTAQPLPEEATQSQYEMTSVMMTQSGILSSMIEGKVPDSKKPPVGIKQNVIIVRSKSASVSQQSAPAAKSSGDTNIIRLDFNKDPSKGGKIIPVENDVDSGAVIDKADPDYRPKSKKIKPPKGFKLKDKPLKFKRGPGRPPIIHNKKLLDVKIPKIGAARPAVPPAQEGALDLSMKPVPPAPNISVVKVEDKKELNSASDIRQKSVTLSEQQERDMEDTIDSVIGGRTVDKERKVPEYEVKEISVSEFKEKKTKKKASEQWTVSHLSESLVSDDDDDDNISDLDSRDTNLQKETSETSLPPYPPPAIAPHLLILQQQQKLQMSRPRGRPKGSTSGLYKPFGSRSPMGRRPGRPPLSGRSPGRPPLTSRSPGRPPLSKSPGMSRSPGRPPLNRSPGRPPLNRSPGRPKSSPGLSPKPRGRPRGSKSPRNRGASPRGGSPRGLSSYLPSEESRDESSTRTFKDNDDSGATMFDFPSRSPHIKTSPVRHISPPRSPSPSETSPADSSPAPTEPALSRENTPDIESPQDSQHSTPEPVRPHRGK